MKINLRNTLAGCAMMAVAAASAQTTCDVAVTAYASPRACALSSQPVSFTVTKNSGPDTIKALTVGVVKNGVKLFEEKKEVSLVSAATVDLNYNIGLEYGKTDTVQLYAKSDIDDTNEANDTLTYTVAMPVCRDFPYIFNAATATSEFTANKFTWDASQSQYYVVGKGATLKNSSLTTPVVKMAEGTQAKYTFNYHVSTANLSLLVMVDYGTERDTIFNEHMPMTSDTEFADYQLSFKSKGPGQVIMRITGAPALKYNELIVSDMCVVEDLPDIEATAITSPSVTTLARQDAGYKVSVTYTNRSSFDIANPVFGYKLGDQTVTETYSGTMAGGDTLIYTFATPMATPAADTCEFVAWSSVSDDANASNDTVKATYVFYDAMAFPYITKFDDGNDKWQIINADGDGYTWMFSSLSGTGGCATYPMTSNAASEDYLVSPAIKMPAGRSRISFYYSGYMQSGTVNLTVLMSTTPDATGVVKTLFSKDLTNNGWLNGFSLIDLEEAGAYYFLFKATGKSDRIFIDNLYVDQDEDLCINDVTCDTESGYDKTTTAVTLSFMNYGVSPQKDIKVRYYINEVAAEEQTVAATVQPGDTVYCTFSTPADISTPDSTYQLKGEIVTVVGPDQNNDVIYGQSIMHWGVKELPYSYGFDDTQRNAQWLTRNDTDGNSSTWKYYAAGTNCYSPSYVLYHVGPVASGTNDWAISECIHMPKGRYEVSFFYRTPVNLRTDTYKQSFSFNLGTDRTPQAMTTNIVTFEDMLNPGQFYKKFTGYIDIAEDGKYYLGFSCNTATCLSSAGLSIEDLEIKPIVKGQELPYAATPNAGWTVYNPRRTNPYWQPFTEDDSTQVMRVQRTSQHAILSSGFEDKLVSPKLSLDAGKNVVITVNYTLLSDSANTAIDISTGHINNSDSLTTVASMPVVTDSVYVDHVFKFTAAEADSAFFVGFRTNSPTDQAAGYVYDARIKKVTIEYDGEIGGIGDVAASRDVAICARNGQLTIAAPTAIGEICVYDLTGHEALKATTELNSVTLDCSALKGIYVVKVTGSADAVVKKIKL